MRDTNYEYYEDSLNLYKEEEITILLLNINSLWTEQWKAKNNQV